MENDIIDKSAGSPWDRGMSDSYYNRGRKPHKKDRLDRIDDLTPKEIEEYYQGYAYNEELGDHKEWDRYY